MSSLAVSFGMPSSSALLASFFIAASAYGVAALPIPRMLALMLAAISSVAHPDWYASGKIMRKSGEIKRASLRIAPARLRSSMIPHQRHMEPHSVSVRLTAPEAPSKTAAESSLILPHITPYTTEAMHISAKTTDNIIISLSLVHVSILDDVQKQQRIFDNKLSKQSNAHFVIMFNCILITLVRASRGVLLIQCKRKSDIL